MVASVDSLSAFGEYLNTVKFSSVGIFMSRINHKFQPVEMYFLNRDIY